MDEILSVHKDIERPTIHGASPQFRAIDFFCGGGGMTCGLRQAGINVIAGVDFDKLVVMREGRKYTDEQIRVLTEFQERWFESEIIRNR